MMVHMAGMQEIDVINVRPIREERNVLESFEEVSAVDYLGLS